jgi:hypothetical protein
MRTPSAHHPGQRLLAGIGQKDSHDRRCRGITDDLIHDETDRRFQCRFGSEHENDMRNDHEYRRQSANMIESAYADCRLRAPLLFYGQPSFASSAS